MSRWQQVLGMPLEQARRAAGEEAEGIRIVRTIAPRTAETEGTLRVIRVRDDEWVVGVFRDGMPGEANA